MASDEDEARRALPRSVVKRRQCALALALALGLLLVLAPSIGRAEGRRALAAVAEPRAVPTGCNLTRAASIVLLRGCGPTSRSTGEGVSCRADLGVPELLSRPVEERFDPALRNPCTRAGSVRYCIPYFYVIGAFHGGVRDLSLIHI